MANVKVTTKRNNGKVEVTDMPQFGTMTSALLQKIRIKTRAAGRGEVLHATYTRLLNNSKQLVANHNNINNEGGEGYVPDMYQSSEFKTWEETVTVK